MPQSPVSVAVNRKVALGMVKSVMCPVPVPDPLAFLKAPVPPLNLTLIL